MPPPWPTHPAPHPADGLPSRDRPIGPRASQTPQPRIGNALQLPTLGNALRPQVQVESSSSESDFQTKRPQRPRHGRSMSHPFPSLFSSKKKKKQKERGDPSGGFGESDSTDAGDSTPKQRGAPQLPTQKTTANHSGKDFATGTCMTCGSLVRWPRELRVFKCAICLTINDLPPPGRDSRRGADPRLLGVGDELLHPRQAPPTAKPISLEWTKSLIKHCLLSFLSAILADSVETNGPREQPRSRQSRSSSTTETTRPGPLELPRMPRESRDLESSSPSHISDLLAKTSAPPTLHPDHLHRNKSANRSYSTSFPDERPTDLGAALESSTFSTSAGISNLGVETKRIFKPLEEYIVLSLVSVECFNNSFIPRHTDLNSNSRGAAEPSRRRNPEPPKDARCGDGSVPDLDPKLLLLGDFAENGSWWTGGQGGMRPARARSYSSEGGRQAGASRMTPVNWPELEEWYSAISNAGETWMNVYDEMVSSGSLSPGTETQLEQAEAQILAAQEHTQRVLLKATETLLKRPGRPITEASDVRYLLMVLTNPLLHASYKAYSGVLQREHGQKADGSGRATYPASRGTGPASGRHSGIIKRILGLMSNAANDCQSHLIYCFSRYPVSHFAQTKDLVSGFLAYRLLRQEEKKQQEGMIDVTAGLIPNMVAGRSAATLHDALGQAPGTSSKKPKESPRKVIYSDDWQIKAAARVLGFLFAANHSTRAHRQPPESSSSHNEAVYPKDRVHARGQMLSTSDFYATLLDSSDLIADFEAWEQKRGKFSFCQYPFLLSIWAKIQILEYDARRQMQNKARDAFFDSIMTRRNVDQYLTLHVRRDCLVEDSLKAVSEVVGSGGEDIKKGLRIVFRGEEGVDAGGLRKEWFLLLVREVFNPDHGMFVYDDDSHYCYFNPSSFETSDQFFLVGVVLGLAIYNSTILDVALPPFAFRKLLMALPPAAAGPTGLPRPHMGYTLDDLAEYRPRLARGLRQLLVYEGDVESTFCLDFTLDVEKYGCTEQVSLCPGGERRPVTNSNRREYVDLYVRYLLDTAVARQFEPFKRGFFTVCGGNALSLFQPEEIELLVRGSDETLDIASLRLAASYDGWKCPDPGENEATVRWFWQTFEEASPVDQRKLLIFITGSDRIPAMGAASLCIRVLCLGDDCGRYPTARTCFNTLSLWRYTSKGRLESMLWDAVHESEGFGLK